MTHCTAEATVTVLESLTAQNGNKLSCMLQRIYILKSGTVYIVGNQLNQTPKSPDITDRYQHTQTGAS